MMKKKTRPILESRCSLYHEDGDRETKLIDLQHLRVGALGEPKLTWDSISVAALVLSIVCQIVSGYWTGLMCVMMSMGTINRCLSGDILVIVMFFRC